MPNSIQPREYSKGGGMDDISRNFDGSLNLLGTNRNDDGSWLNTYYDNPDNRWNRDNGFAFAVSQISSFLLRIVGGVLFLELSVPPAEHPANFIHFFRKRDIFFIIQRFCFPKHHQEQFQRIHFSDGESNIGQFFLTSEECRLRSCLYCFYPQFVNTAPERMAMELRQGLVIFKPEFVRRFYFLEQRQERLAIASGGGYV